MVGNLVVWERNQVLQVPIGALFRSDGQWAVFVAAGEVAELRKIEVGQMNRDNAQVLEGVNAGETVILYPNDTLENGGLIERRNAS